ncbi:MAG: InlB B-repeat-containing protein, partial [Candidatus Riflebacteria bacterium]|nr:InlB B-repeat-containing protein [Candidatus Riflebacteria bacterium]
MSRIKNNIIFTSFISFLVIFLFFSCRVGQEKPIVENKAFLSIIVDRVDYNNDFARTVLPSSDVSDFTDFELSMTRSDGLTNSYSFADYEVLVSSTIGIETGEWSFTLSSGEFSSSISQTIESGENNLSFRLDYVGSQNTGNISVSLSFPNDERVKLVNGGLLNITSEREIQGYEMEAMELIENESSMSVLYSKQNVPAGYYFIKWNIYGDLDAKVLLESKKELVLIDGGITSSDAIEMEDFLNLYDITYNLEDGSFEESFVPPCSFSKISDFDLPKASNLIKDGQFFEGWYTSPDYEGNRIDFIKAGTSGNLNLYAKWKDIDVRTVES